MKRENIFNIRETAEILVPDKIARKSYLYVVGLALVMMGMISVLLRTLPPQVPLYFTLPWGEARLAPKQMLFVLPGLVWLLLVVNLMIARAVSTLSLLLPRVLAVATLVMSGMLFVALFGIVQSLVL